MALIDMADALDADICEPFTIQRYNGQFVAGGYQEAPTAIPSFGVISAPTGDELNQVPEGDRVTGAIVVHTQALLLETNSKGTSDELVWQGQRYQVVKVWVYQNRNYYKAYAVRMSGV